MTGNAEDPSRNGGIHKGFPKFRAEMRENNHRAFVGSNSESGDEKLAAVDAEDPKALGKGYKGEVEMDIRSGCAEEQRKLVKSEEEGEALTAVYHEV